MIYGFLSRLARVRFTVGYLVALVSVSAVAMMLTPQEYARLLRHASTNLHNLSHGRLGTLLGSAFVVEAGPIYFWMPFLTCLLVLAELQLHSIRLLVAFLVGHIGATLVVAAALAGAVEMGWMPWSITRATDVGMSYGALATLGALTAAIPRRLRPAWIGWWISVSVAAGLIGGEFTNGGHAVAVLLGMLASTRFRASAHWTPVRCVMLVLSSGFGFLVLGHSWLAMGAGVLFGAVGALIAHKLVRPEPVPGAPEPHDVRSVPLHC